MAPGYLLVCLCTFQAKKKFYDVELENLERQQKQQVEKMEQDHSVRRKEEAKRIRLEQDRDYAKFQEQLKQMKKEVVKGCGSGSRAGSGAGAGQQKNLEAGADIDAMGLLFTGLLLTVCSASLLVEARATRTNHSKLGPLHQSSIKKMLPRLSTGQSGDSLFSFRVQLSK